MSSGNDRNCTMSSKTTLSTPANSPNQQQEQQQHQQQRRAKPLQLGFSLSHLRRTLSALKEAVDEHGYHSRRRALSPARPGRRAVARGGARRRHRRRRQLDNQNDDDDDNDDNDDPRNRNVEFFEEGSDDDDDVDVEEERDEEEEEDEGIDVDPVDVHEQVTSTTEALQDAAIAIAKASMVSIMSLTLKERDRHKNKLPQELRRRRRLSGTSSHDDSSNPSFLLQLPWKQRHGMMHDLREIFDTVVHVRRAYTVEFYKLWREWVLLLLRADHCRELQLFGWEQLEELVRASAQHRPPPRTYVVEGAGVDFVNGVYHYAGKLTEDGYAYTSAGLSSGGAGWRSSSGRRLLGDDGDEVVLDDDIMDDPTAPHYASTLAALSNSCSRYSYERIAVVPRRNDVDEDEDENAEENSDNNVEEEMEEKKITLFQCTMQSKQKWWFLSEADEEQPGTDRDIDYYEHSRSWRTSARQHRNGRPTNAAAAARQRMMRRMAEEDVSAYGDVQYQDELPPTTHWKTSKDGVGPVPKLTRSGYMVPAGQETNTLEHQLAQWMLLEDILHLAIRQSSRCHQVANHYLPLVMKFGATLFELEGGQGGFSSTAKGTQFIVQISQWFLLTNDLATAADLDGKRSGCAGRLQKQLSSSSISTNSTRSETSFSSARIQDEEEEFIAMMNRQDSCTSSNANILAVMDKESERRLMVIADWLSDDVLLYPKEEDVLRYAQIFMNVGLDSVDAILEDLTADDLDSLAEFSPIKTFHKRRIRQHLLERGANGVEWHTAKQTN